MTPPRNICPEPQRECYWDNEKLVSFGRMSESVDRQEAMLKEIKETLERTPALNLKTQAGITSGVSAITAGVCVGVAMAAKFIWDRITGGKP